MRRRYAGLRFDGRIGGRAAQKGGELKHGRPPLALQRRNAGADLGHQAFGPDHVEPGIGAGVVTLAGDLGLAADDIKRVTRHGELFAEGADLGVGAGGLGGDGDLQPVARGGGGLGVGMGSLDRSPHPAEQVQFVGHIENVVEQPDGLRLVATDLDDLVGGGVAAIDGAKLGRGRRIAPRPRGLQHRPGRGKISLRDRQIGIGRQGVVQQPVQQGILIEPPPVVGRRGGGLDRGLDRDQRGLSPGRRRRRVKLGTLDAAGEQAQRGQQRQGFANPAHDVESWDGKNGL